MALAVARPGADLRTAAGPGGAGNGGPRRVAVVRLRRRLRAALQPRPLRPRPRARAGGAACSPARARGLALVLCALCSLASPVAGRVPGAGARSRGRSRARTGDWRVDCALAALVPIGALALLFPEGGTQPFVPSAFWAPLAAVVLLALMAGREQRLLRTGAAAVRAAADRGLSWCRARWEATPRAWERCSGGRWRRWSCCGASVPALRPRDGCGCWRRWRRSSIFWQINAPLARLPRGPGQPVGERLLLRPPAGASCAGSDVGYGARPARIEVVPTAAHWEARWVAPARDDRPRLGAPAGPGAQRALLRRPSAPVPPNCTPGCSNRAVSLVALPDAHARLLRQGRGAAAARGGRPPTCAKSGARHTGACSRSPIPAAAVGPGILRSVSTDRADLSLPRAGRLPAAPSLHALLGAAVRAAAAWSAPPGTGRGCSRGRPGVSSWASASRSGACWPTGPRCT